MCTYSNQDLADMYGVSKNTLINHVNKLKEQSKFEKSSIGKSYNQIDAENLSKLLGFILKQPKTIQHK